VKRGLYTARRSRYPKVSHRPGRAERESAVRNCLIQKRLRTRPMVTTTVQLGKISERNGLGLISRQEAELATRSRFQKRGR